MPAARPTTRDATVRATCLIRHSPTNAEREIGELRTLHLKVFPESAPIFEENFGLRNDVESMHNDLKTRMIGRRARATTQQRQALDMAAWTVFNNPKAVINFTERTGRAPPCSRLMVVAWPKPRKPSNRGEGLERQRPPQRLSFLRTNLA